MRFSDYTFLYNAAAYFAAREHFGAAERQRLEAHKAEASTDVRRTPEYKTKLEQLRKDADAHELVPMLSDTSAAGFDALCWAVAELTTQGELLARYMGRDKRELLTQQRVRVELKPSQIAEAKMLVMQAIIKGVRQEDEEDAEVDEVLEELQKKTQVVDATSILTAGGRYGL